ncbi:MAG: NAD(P)-dependent oxidoreductase [Lachnospiraceae bacterium]|nr:NAD(P)-dependent oxidoreductase [Lachnospiraceae bacterium]
MSSNAIDKYNPGTYLITGATGFIGSMVVNRLVESEEFKAGNIKLVLQARNEDKFWQMYEELRDTYNTYDQYGYRDDDRSQIYPLLREVEDIDIGYDDEKAIHYYPELDYIIHCAANTTSSVMISNPVETANGIVIGTKCVLELAKIENVKGMVYLSSMEVYGDIKCSPESRATEDMLGNIDILKSRSSYPLGKRMAECYCSAYANEYCVPVKIARLAQVFGKGIKSGENRSFAQFARAVAEGRDIVLKTEGKSINNSVASEDAIDAIFFLLYNGENGQAYNVVNEKNSMSIRDMAELVARQLSDGRSKVVIDVEDSSKTGYAADTGLYMSGEKLRQLGFEAKKDLVDMYRDVMECLQEMEKDYEQQKIQTDNFITSIK